MTLTRIFFTSDVHGSDVCFMKFLNAAKFYQANVLILGGDITGKMIVPIVQQSDGTLFSDFLGNRRVVKGDQERAALERNIRNSGYYPYLSTPAEIQEISNDKKRLDELFSEVRLFRYWKLQGLHMKLGDRRLTKTTRMNKRSRLPDFPV